MVAEPQSPPGSDRGGSELSGAFPGKATRCQSRDQIQAADNSHKTIYCVGGPSFALAVQMRFAAFPCANVLCIEIDVTGSEDGSRLGVDGKSALGGVAAPPGLRQQGGSVG